MKYDIVYLLKNDIDSNEIRYSLRSIEKNFPYNKVWFVSGCPEGIKPDGFIDFQQVGDTKWKRSTSALAAACRNDEITEDFWLFNDDFFVIRKVRSIKPMISGTLLQRCKKVEARNGNMQTGYTRQLRRAAHVLRINGYTQYDFALHVPMLINKAKALEVMNKFPDCPMFRSLYGNYCELESIKTKDVKITDLKMLPDEDAKFVSTEDKSFLKGAVGEYIRDLFPEPSKYEV